MKPFRLLLALALAGIVFSSCRKEDPPQPSNTGNSSLWTFHSLAGETWVLTAYHDTAMTTNIPASDTLVFTGEHHFTWNGVPCAYNYYFYGNSNRTHLELSDTPFGDLMAVVPDQFQAFGELNGVLFSNRYYMWLERI